MMDRWMNARWMDGGKNKFALAHLTMKRSHVASLVKFSPCIKEEIV